MAIQSFLLSLSVDFMSPEFVNGNGLDRNFIIA